MPESKATSRTHFILLALIAFGVIGYLLFLPSNSTTAQQKFTPTPTATPAPPAPTATFTLTPTATPGQRGRLILGKTSMRVGEKVDAVALDVYPTDLQVHLDYTYHITASAICLGRSSSRGIARVLAPFTMRFLACDAGTATVRLLVSATDYELARESITITDPNTVTPTPTPTATSTFTPTRTSTPTSGVSSASLTPDPSSVYFRNVGNEWHRFTVNSSERVVVVANPSGTSRRVEIRTSSSTGNICPAETEDDFSRSAGQNIYLAGCVIGTGTVELRRASDNRVLRTYTFTVNSSSAPTPTHTPTATSTYVPTHTPSVTHTPRVQPTATHTTTMTATHTHTTTPTASLTCNVQSLGTVSDSITRNGSWNSDCDSTNGGDKYARYYSFSLSDSAEVTIDLTSTTDPYLFLLRGIGKNGSVVTENDDISGDDRNSRIVRTLDRGSYTIEATTYGSRRTGDFTLTVEGRITATATPTPTPTPTGTPRPGSTPTATSTATYTPTPTATTISSSCIVQSLGTVSDSITRNGSWSSDCDSVHRTARGTHYARYYSFALSDSAEVTMELTSATDPYVILLSGNGKNGSVIEENDDFSWPDNHNSRITRTLQAGTYTVEVTTFDNEDTGSFTLNVRLPDALPEPTQTPTATYTPTATLPAVTARINRLPSRFPDDREWQELRLSSSHPILVYLNRHSPTGWIVGSSTRNSGTANCSTASDHLRGETSYLYLTDLYNYTGYNIDADGDGKIDRLMHTNYGVNAIPTKDSEYMRQVYDDHSPH